MAEVEASARRARRPAEVVPAVPADVQARWRAAGAWNGETLVDRLASAPARYTGDVVVDGPHRLTARDVAERSARVAAYLHGRGVRRGDVVAWQLPNWWEAVVWCWGVWRAGAVASPITPTLRAREVGFVLRQTGARVLAVPHTFRGVDYPALAREAGAAVGVDLVVVRGAPGAPGADFARDVLGTADPAPAVAVEPADPAVVLWTSGTTSDPKGVVHSHQGLRCEADGIAAAHELAAGEPLLLPMPVTHVAGLTYGVVLPCTTGVRAVLMDVWEPGQGLRLLERERVAVMISTPVFLRGLADHPDFDPARTASLRLFSLGGAGVAPSMVREGAARFGAGGCRCKRTYGSTEYPTLTTGQAGDDLEHDATTDGRIIGAGEVRIVDPESGEDLPAGRAGELWVRGPEMFAGYLDPALDAEAFAPGGWFRTGDLATFDGTHLRIVDRLKDVIIRGGENISAAEVEGLLATHPAVAEAACVAVPDPAMGERVCAVVVPRPGARITLADLAAHLRAAGVAPFKLPERLEVRADLPRTPSGKVQKAVLREELAGAGGASRGARLR